MGKFKFSLAILAILFILPNTAGEIQITANNEANYLSVDSGQEIIFKAFGTDNATSILWDFSRNISGPDTRYSNASEVIYTVHAAGRYNITLTVNYENSNSSLNELVLIVNEIYTFDDEIINNEALFFALAATEVIMSVSLAYWTSLIRKEKVYL